MSIQIITTSDGSHSLLNTTLNETYHSVHGALRESEYVFIKNGLAYFSTVSNADPIRILEVGFGTGLNALLALQWGLESKRNIWYETLEPFPLAPEIWQSLNYAGTPETKKLFLQLHESLWDSEQKILPHFTLIKRNATLQAFGFPRTGYDVIFYDAFAPSKQPEMWDISVLKKVGDAMRAGSVFVTYCAKGQLKRDLKSLGLTVETLPGPPGKKEMVKALKNS
jgi:tRNA U34 5-methylaminomethyl-2-thiouridine-forming methyltransferase MnmC